MTHFNSPHSAAAFGAKLHEVPPRIKAILMAKEIDLVASLGELPPSHAGRLRFLATADPSVIAAVRFGVLFVMALWSGPSLRAFTQLKQALAAADPGGNLEVIVIDADGSAGLQGMPEFAGKLHGWGECAWIKDGRVAYTSGRGFHPEVFDPLTRRFMAEASPALPRHA